MDKLVFKIITQEEDKKLVLERIKHYTGVTLPSAYADSAKVVGGFLQENLVAGYMLVTKPNLRSLLFVPDSVKDRHHFFSNDVYDMMEVNGLWIGPSLRSPLQQLRVWKHLIVDIFSCRKKYVLLMRSTKNKSMERFMGMSNPKPIFQGPPALMAGENSHNSIQVSYTTRWSLILNAHKYFAELIRRQYKAHQSSRNRQAARSNTPLDTELASL